MPQALDQLLRQTPYLWRAGELAQTQARSTGFAALDALLPGRGWPCGALIELLPAVAGIGELRLLLPALAQLCREARDIVFIQPPHVPYPPALAKAGLPLNRIVWIAADSDAHARWAAEQTLQEGLAGAVLLWSDCTQDARLRRLQLAARDGESLTFLYRAVGTPVAASPAAVRLHLTAAPQGLQVEVLKAQGGRTGSVLLQGGPHEQ